MARGYQRVVIFGTLGADPETRYTAGGLAITSIRVATSESWKDKQTGEKQEKTAWHRIKFFGRVAEIAGEYLKKGRHVLVEGKLEYGEYTDKEGIKRYTCDVIGEQMQMVGGAPTGEGGQRGGGPVSQRGEQPKPGRGAPAPSDSFEDDEIPFVTNRGLF